MLLPILVVIGFLGG
ncbi:Protein of unknown function [Bacillus wiedmannii]|uniref:Uncharacterized protein n=1 Tax=Bacillus wiedmannii TaxID=1890302 RepID=A0A1C3YTQ3_9BACI|nr:Protein of unknown function [Bacillus wiedmannii]SCN00122.1 Protein of unknown function [Bacillus wiedmannii]